MTNSPYPGSEIQQPSLWIGLYVAAPTKLTLYYYYY